MLYSITSSPPLVWPSLGPILLSLLPKPPTPGPRGCLTTPPGLSWPPFNVAELNDDGRLGTGGIAPPGLLNGLDPLENNEPKAVETRREGDAIVA